MHDCWGYLILTIRETVLNLNVWDWKLIVWFPIVQRHQIVSFTNIAEVKRTTSNFKSELTFEMFSYSAYTSTEDNDEKKPVSRFPVLASKMA